MYKLVQNGVIKLPDNIFIPNDPANRHYQEYQEWLKKGNTPIPEYVSNDCINFESFTYDENCIFQKLSQQKKEEILSLEKQRLNKILDTYDYNGLADVQLSKQTGQANGEDVSEETALLSWYESYDNLIWSWINNNLTEAQTLEELLSLDIKQIEQDIFNNSIQKNPLP
jgi:sulfur relay (sulfurtransferase) DsrF/TusC family protein